VDTSRDTLTAERANAQLAGQRLIATVQLIKALGGGWNKNEIVPTVSAAKFQPETVAVRQTRR
jgi:outer membrane protein TolC